MSLSETKDQQVATKLLRGIIRRDRIPNGLLFWGPYGVGKRMTAFEFAKAVNCRESADDACDECLSCRKANHGNHADIKRIKPVSKTRIITVDKIEEVIETTMFRPVEGGRRIFLIEDADRINEQAQNHFLKTLEEPPSQSVFVLITERPRQLLPTIRSRCQAIRFGVLQMDTVADMIKRDHGCSDDQAYAIAALAQGSVSRAHDLVATERRTVVLDIIQRLIRGEDPLMVSEDFAAHIQDTEKAIESAVKSEAKQQVEADATETVVMEKEALEALVAGLVRGELFEYLVLFDAWCRDELVYSLTRDTQIIYNRDHLQQLRGDIDAAKQDARINAVTEAWKYIERNLKPARVFRDLFFNLAS